MRVLIIEDSDADFCLIGSALGDQFKLTRATSLASGIAAGRNEQFELLILDLSLHDSQGYQTFEQARANLPELPIVILSGSGDEDLALRAVANGAQDFVPKARLPDPSLALTARYAIERRRVDQQYRTQFDNLPTAVYVCDTAGVITYYNKTTAQLWGRAPRVADPAERFCGAFKLFTTDGTRISNEHGFMARSMREQSGFSGRELVIELPSGERRSMLANANPIIAQGEVRGAIGVLVDVSNLRRVERELRESERFARATVDALGAHIAILDEAGMIVAVNASWQRFALANDMPAGSGSVGTNYLHVCASATGPDSDEAAQAEAGIRAVLCGSQQVFELEYPCHSPEEERWFAMRATAFEGEGPRRVVVSHENITSRKMVERLAKEQCGLREAVAGMEQVLGVVGHELRTPLAALRAISEFLLSDGARNTSEAERFLQEISQEVDRMSETVNNLLEAARLNSGRATWNWSEVDLAETIDDAIASVRPLVNPARVKLDADLDATATCMLGDADAIRRLLVNLLSNAKKHTTDGWIQVRTRHRCDSTGPWVELAVEDSGCGIPPELVDRLGEAFALNSGVVGRNYVGGTGLGLAICKGIAHAHGGQIRIRSAPGKGTTVVVRLRQDLQAAAQGDTNHIRTLEEVEI